MRALLSVSSADAAGFAPPSSPVKRFTVPVGVIGQPGPDRFSWPLLGLAQNVSPFVQMNAQLEIKTQNKFTYSEIHSGFVLVQEEKPQLHPRGFADESQQPNSGLVVHIVCYSLL